MFKFSDKKDLMKCGEEFENFMTEVENDELDFKMSDYLVYSDDYCDCLKIDDMYVGLFYDVGESLCSVDVEDLSLIHI